MSAAAPPPASVAAFEDLAADYDASFTDTLLGRRYRRAVWRRFDACFAPGADVLELNCGTGEDAVELARRGVSVLATDVAPAMLACTRAKAEAAALRDRVRTRLLDLADPADLADLVAEGPRFDGALSNFGGLNCVADLTPVADALARLVRPGGLALLCLMGPHVPGEWLWFFTQRQPRRALRRLRPVRWRGLEIHYPSRVHTCRVFARSFAVRRSWGLGALLPPPAAEAWARRHPRTVGLLDAVERRIEAWPGVNRLSDHYVVELVRR